MEEDFENSLTYIFGKDYSNPVYIQRYEQVSTILRHHATLGKIKKVIDFGAGELKFIKYIKTINQLTHITAIDVDEPLLQRLAHRVAPLAFDYIMENRRLNSLDIQIFAGSIIDVDERLLDHEAVTCIELIEHLENDVLQEACNTIFRYIQPNLAIFTTPNAEFNVLFSELKGFRHWDHKFEWSREEFQSWCSNITKEYPEYEVKIAGIGEGPSGSEHLGCCSQLAIFTKENSDKRIHNLKRCQPYKLIAQFHYPQKELLNQDDYLFHSAMYYIRSLGRNLLEDGDDDFVKISLEKILKLPSVSKICANEEHLRITLTNNGIQLHTEGESSFVIYHEEDSENHFTDIENEEVVSRNSDDENYLYSSSEMWDS